MRNRYFFTILVVLLIVTLGTVALHSRFLQQERLRLIDQQVRETASALLNSELADLGKIDLQRADEIISEELGENRVGKFFVVRNAKGDVLFESMSAKVLPLSDLPQSPQWLTIRGRGKFIRVLNLQLPRIPDRTLQVGLLLDEELIVPSYFSPSSALFATVVLTLGLLASAFLTAFLLRPIARLESYISAAANRSPSQPVIPPLPKELLERYSGGLVRDEFHHLLVGLGKLIDRVNGNSSRLRLWTYHMAHELKTPLSRLMLELEGLQAGPSSPAAQERNKAIGSEVSRISDTVGSFLGWAEIEDGARPQTVYAVKLAQTLELLLGSLPERDAARIEFPARTDLVAFATPAHVEQVFSNLIVNALKYSDPKTPIVIEMRGDRVSFRDRGPGIPAPVLERLGEPFNRGGERSSARRGHGLGLAWVLSIARLYGWKVSFESAATGSDVSLSFPPPS